MELNKKDRLRKRLYAAVLARLVWHMMAVPIIYFADLPYQDYLIKILITHFTLNVIAAFIFYTQKFSGIMTYIIITADAMVVAVMILLTGFISSPFNLLFLVITGFTVLVASAAHGIYIAVFASALAVFLDISYMNEMLPSGLKIGQFSPIIVWLHAVVVPFANLTIVGILWYVVHKLEASEENLFRQGQQLAERNNEMKADLAIARTVQDSIQPKKLIKSDSIQICFLTEPMLEVGGDFVAIVSGSEYETGILIADVSGHGAGSALITAMLKVSADRYMVRDRSPGLALFSINNEICKIIADSDFYLTCFLVYINKITGEIKYAGAAHPECLLISESGSVSSLSSQGSIIGTLPDMKYPENKLTAEPGSRLILYTDGITEARNRDKAEFGTERLLLQVQQNATDSLETLAHSIIQATTEFAGSGMAADDRTVVVVEMQHSVSLSIQKETLPQQSILAGYSELRRLIRAGDSASVSEKINQLQQHYRLPVMAQLRFIRLLTKTGDTQSAVEHLVKLAPVVRDNIYLLEETGKIYMRLGMRNEARANWQAAVELNPDFGFSRYYLEQYF